MAPIFIGEIEDVRKEIRDVLERCAVTHQSPRAVLALGDCIVPVFDTPALFKEQILVVCNVTYGIDSGLARLEVLIYYHAVRHVDSAVGEHACYWPSSDPCNHHLTFDLSVAFQQQPIHPVIAASPS